MAKSGIRLYGDWRQFEKALGPAFRRQFKKESKKGLTRLAQRLQKEVIGKGSFAPNTPMAIHIKGRNSPLQDMKGIERHIRSKIAGDNTLWIGIPKSSKFFKPAMLIHEGGSIKVTDAMRGMFKLLWLKSQGKDVKLTGRAAELWRRKQGGWKPLRTSTTRLFYKSRPFMREAFDNPETKAMVAAEFHGVIQRTFNHFAKRAGR